MPENETPEVVLTALRAEQARIVLLDQVLSHAPPEQVMEHATDLGIDLGGRRSVRDILNIMYDMLSTLNDI